jgi:hypothetical protein
MTLDQMSAELDKLNKQQLRALRHVLAGRGVAKSINVDHQISKATVTFGLSNGLEVTHFIMLGPRGRIVYHEKSCN